jgi:hypothetical protein
MNTDYLIHSRRVAIGLFAFGSLIIGKVEIRPLSETDFYYVDADIEMTFKKEPRSRWQFYDAPFGTDYEFLRVE